MPKLRVVTGRTYGTYASQRLFRILCDLKHERRNMGISDIAAAISEWRLIEFPRINLYRLRDDKLSDQTIEIIVSWLGNPPIFNGVHP